MSKNHGAFYCLHYLHYTEGENKRESHEKVCENKDFCNAIMSSEDTKMLKLNQYQNLMRHYLLFTQILNVY